MKFRLDDISKKTNFKVNKIKNLIHKCSHPKYSTNSKTYLYKYMLTSKTRNIIEVGSHLHKLYKRNNNDVVEGLSYD